MARIVLFVPPAAGAMNATSRVAEELTALGHTILYAGVPDCGPFLRNSGYELKTLFAEYFPEGFFQAAARRKERSWRRQWWMQRKLRSHMERFFTALNGPLRDEFSTTMREVSPDLCLVAAAYQDSTFWLLLLHELRIPCAYLNDTFIRGADPAAPPASTRLMSNGTAAAFTRNRRAWQWLFMKKRLIETSKLWLGLGVDWREQFTALADTCGYPAKQLSFDHPISPRLALPELVLWHEAFDFPGAATANRVYVGPLIDPHRDEGEPPWLGDALQKPVVYCALGSMRFLPKSVYRRFYQAVIDAAATRPQEQWIVAVGDLIEAEDLCSVPANATVCKRAPQTVILRRAKCMITHGGANSVKECVWFGVPMIVLPLALDHPGMAARVLWHGLGFSADVRRVSAHELACLVQQLEDDPGPSSRVHAMTERFQAVTMEPLVAALEWLLANQALPGPAGGSLSSGRKPRL